jgi:hypothetical protein
MSLLLGFIDEWRDYFEVYPACVVLMVHTIIGRSASAGSTLRG